MAEKIYKCPNCENVWKKSELEIRAETHLTCPDCEFECGKSEFEVKPKKK